MNFYDVLLIGFALSMDAFAITIANCITYKNKLSHKKEWCMPLFFGIFQGLMPLLGYYLGWFFADYFEKFAGFITAGIFFVLSIKIIIDNIKEIKSSAPEKDKQVLTYKILILQALATSIDAFAIGITFSVGLAINIYLAVGIIIVVTFIIISAALIFGKFFGKIFGTYAQWGGAIILLGLAIKELIKALL